MQNEKIWVVYNPQGRAPTFTHTSYESAKTEARRLARANPEQRFYVMESRGFAIKNDVSFYAYERPGVILDEDEIPF